MRSLRLIGWFIAGVFIVAVIWPSINYMQVRDGTNRVLPHEIIVRQHLVSLGTLAFGSLLGGWLAGWGWRRNQLASWSGIGGMIVGLGAALLVTIGIGGFIEGFAYDPDLRPSASVDFLSAVARFTFQTIVYAFGIWEFAKVAVATGLGMLGGMIAGRRLLITSSGTSS